MRRRICIFGAAFAVGPLAVAAVVAPAANAQGHKKKPMFVSCALTATTQVPWGSTQVLPASSPGSQWGSTQCDKRIGGGFQRNTFTISTTTGNMAGTWASYFRVGVLHGTFLLTPGEGTLGTNPSSFGGGTFTGTEKITGGLGAYKGAKGKGTLTCASPDGLHFKCHEQLDLTKF